LEIEFNRDIDSNSTYLETETNITVTANPAVEGGGQNSEVAAHGSSKATLSNITALKLQDILATVMTAIQAEGSKQTAVVKTEIAKLAETIKAQFRQETEKHVASLTDRFEAANENCEKNWMLNYSIKFRVFPKD